MISESRHQGLQKLEELIGYQFSNRERLDRALTHSSAREPSSGNYERLEFLGDRILGLCIAELLFGRFSDADEGELSVRLNNLVSAEACANIADEMNLHEFITTGSDVKSITSPAMLSVRADVMESLIAAIYLDGGLEAAREFILKFWTSRALAKTSVRRDAKTELQEWSHSKFKKPPVYRVISRDGPDHAPTFVVEVVIDDAEKARGEAKSKRGAEQVAAEVMLLREGIWEKDN